MKTQAHVRELLSQIRYNNVKSIIASANGNTDVASRHRQRINELEQEIVDMYETPDMTEWITFEHINECKEHQRLWGYYHDGSIRPGVVQCRVNGTKFLDTLDGSEYPLPLTMQPLFICVRDVFDVTPPLFQKMRIECSEQPDELATKWTKAKNLYHDDYLGHDFWGCYPDGTIHQCSLGTYKERYVFHFDGQNIVHAHDFQPWYVIRYIVGAEMPVPPLVWDIRLLMNQSKSWNNRLFDIVSTYGPAIKEKTGLNIPEYQIDCLESGVAEKWCKTILKYLEKEEGSIN